MEIIDCLLRDDSVEDEIVSVVPIFGIGGLGKTTLVQLVYDDELVERHFDLKMWVHVSDVFDVKVIAERVIVSETGRKLEDVGLNQLQAHLQKHFDGMRFLLVLDDVRDEDLEKWHNLRRLFVFGARGSKIIVTTRSMVVANIAGTLPPYHLRGLSMVESWSFSKKIVFSGQELESPYLIKMGKEIVKKCAGVPLAIKTIGSLLFFKRTAAEWLPVVQSLFPRIPQQEFDILAIVKLSFNHLPSHLKHCFAYCSLFPNGNEIYVQGLIQIWIAQGLIRSSYSSESLEDIGVGYFKDLDWRSFFQEVAKDRLGNVVRCKMHHLIRDLAISVVGNEATISHPNVIFIDEKTGHVSFDFDTDGDFSWQIPMSLFKATRLRTFLSLSKLSPLVFQSRSRVELDEGQLDAIFRHLKHLLVLDMHDFKIGTIPCSISKLMHLRYLDLSYNERIERLPNCITKLRNLQVLNLSHCDELKELPKYIKNLVNLRHLKFEGCWNLTHMPCGLGQLTSLHTLTWFIVPNNESVFTGIGGLNELNSLNNLRGKIDIRNLGYVNGDLSAFKGANLKGKQHLQSLSLYWGRDAGKSSVNPSHDEESLQSLRPHPNLKEFYVYDYAGVKFPTMFSSLANLISIWIQDCKRCIFHS